MGQPERVADLMDRYGLEHWRRQHPTDRIPTGQGDHGGMDGAVPGPLEIGLTTPVLT